MAHPNEDLLRAAFAAFTAGDLDQLRRATAPDIVWHSPGRNMLSGTYKGPDEVLRFLARWRESTDETLHVDLHDVVANDEHAFAAYVSTARRGERALRLGAVLLCHVADGKVREVWQMNGDQYAVDEFLS
jgi:uncharacterized protein